jgi:hypothetical protein
MAWTRSVPNSSKQPTWTPASMTIGSPVSNRRITGATKLRLMWASPEARALVSSAPATVSTYCTSVNPSPCRSASATYWGAMQIPETLTSLIFVVSGGGSATTGLDLRPNSPAVPAKVSPCKNSRRLQRAVWGALMETSSLIKTVRTGMSARV